MDSQTATTGRTIVRPGPDTRTRRELVPRWLDKAGSSSWRLLALGAVIYATAMLAQRLYVVVAALLIAIFVTAILRPVTEGLARRGVPRTLAAAICALLQIALLVGMAGAVAYIISRQLGSVTATVQQGWNTISGWLRDLGFGAVTDGQLAADATDMLRAKAGDFASMLASWTMQAVTVLTIIALAVAISFFLLRDGRRLVSHSIDYLPVERRDKVRERSAEIWERVEGYIRGLGITAVANSLMKGLALLLIGIPFVIPIMVLTFIGSFIPYAGPVIATGVAALVALGHTGLTDALLVIGAGIIIQQIEGNLLHPFVVGRSVQLAPLTVLLAVVSGAILAGLLGAFIAVPVAATISLLLEHSKRDREALEAELHPEEEEDEIGPAEHWQRLEDVSVERRRRSLAEREAMTSSHAAQ